MRANAEALRLPAERWLPVAWVTALAVGVTLIALGLERFIAPCLFREVTGFYCPGCGSGRVVRALLGFDVAAAWRANPLALVALPPAGYALVREALGAWRIAELPWPRLGKGWAWAVLGVVLGFWLLRNVAIWPFVLLAPR